MANKTYDKVMDGKHDNNILFVELVQLLHKLNFTETVTGDHHKFTRSDIGARIVIQPNKEKRVQAYQVREIRKLFKDYKIKE